MPAASIHPVVLVGGRSRRYGRDKLLEPIPGSGAPLVSASVDALRAVFGPRVAIVGTCDARIEELADLRIADEHPGVGPIGGIISALRTTAGDVFIASGDLPGLDAATVRLLLDSGAAAPGALAVLAETDRIHPCLGLYRHAALGVLAAQLAAGQHRLVDALPAGRTATVPVPGASAININAAADWSAWRAHRPG